MKNLVVLLAFTLLLHAGCNDDDVVEGPLSPPIIQPELYACASSISVSGFVPGAKIDIYANRTTRIGGGVSDSPWGQVYSVNPELIAYDSITARQTFDGITSPHSKALQVRSYRKDGPGGLTKPELEEPIYDCGGAIGVRNLVRGGLLKVYADGVEIGRVKGCGVGQWLTVSPLFSTGQYISADEELCTQTSPKSDSVLVGPAPDFLPKPTVGDIYENGKYCTLGNIIQGAQVRVYNGSTMISEHHYSGGGQIVRLTPQVLPGDTITAEQQLCTVISEPSDPSIVKPCSELPPPVLGPICAGDDVIKVVEGVLGARIIVYRDGVLVADGGGAEVNLFGPANDGENYWATQSLESCVSPISVAIAVGCDKPKIMRPNIPNSGRAVSISVETDDNNIMVASETGGLFRSRDKGKNWTHVSGSTTFRYSDLTYLDFEKGTIIATARVDSRPQSGGGIWRSTDEGSTWKRVSITTPNAACLTNITGYCLSVDNVRERVWAGTSCGLAYSDNAGLTWTFQPVVTGYNNDKTYSVKTPDTARIVIMTDAGIKVSNDAGLTFSNPMTGIPNARWAGVHNQIDVAPNDANHLYWAFNYIPNGDSVSYHGLYQSVDFGANWKSVIADQAGANRAPFVRTSFSMKGGSGTYDVYWGDGSCALRMATADTGSIGSLTAWTSLVFDHCDPSDLGFEKDDATPLLLLSDGGLHKTEDQGANWKMSGAGPYGYNALQITEVTGQLHNADTDVDLYFATQDNHIWASPDHGVSWPATRCCEGFFLNIMRDYYPPNETRLTGVSCGGCGNFISKPVLDGHTGFSNPPNDQGNPRLLKPKNYIQNTLPKDSTGSFFMLTSDNGSSWNMKYKFPEAVTALSQIAGPLNSPVVFTAYNAPGVTPGGQQIINIKKITGVLGAGTPVVSNITNFGSLGVFPTMFAWYKPYGVDPDDPNFIIVADIVDQFIKVTTDGGAIWKNDTILTNLITANGKFQFSWNEFTQLSTIGFNPECAGHILVGTQQAGIFTSYNRGASWGRIPGTEFIPYVSSFFFTGADEAIASSYGRGLWKLSFPCQKLQEDEDGPKGGALDPIVYLRGVKTPLMAIQHSSSMEHIGYFLVSGSQIFDYRIDPTSNVMQEVTLSKGEIRGYSSNGKTIDNPFKVSVGDARGNFSGHSEMSAELDDKVQIKGLVLENGTFKGAILAEKDITTDQLPKPPPLEPYITILNHVSGMAVVQGLDKIRLSGRNFNPNYPLEIFLNGEPVDLISQPEIDNTGNFNVEFPQKVEIGGHVILVKQQTDDEILQDIATFLKRVDDREN